MKRNLFDKPAHTVFALYTVALLVIDLYPEALHLQIFQSNVNCYVLDIINLLLLLCILLMYNVT